MNRARKAKDFRWGGMRADAMAVVWRLAWQGFADKGVSTWVIEEGSRERMEFSITVYHCTSRMTLEPGLENMYSYREGTLCWVNSTILDLSLNSLVAFSKSLNLSGSQIAHLSNQHWGKYFSRLLPAVIFPNTNNFSYLHF